LLKISEGLRQNAQRFEIDDGVKAAQPPQSPPAIAYATAQNPGGGSKVLGSETATPRQGLPVYGYSTNTPAPNAQQAQSNGSATLIPANWQPEATWIKQCQQHNIPEDFLWDAVPEFVQYWRDRGQARFSWGNAFYKHVLKLWREEQTRRGAFEQASEMSAAWRPSPQALSILQNAGVNPHFIEDALKSMPTSPMPVSQSLFYTGAIVSKLKHRGIRLFFSLLRPSGRVNFSVTLSNRAAV